MRRRDLLAAVAGGTTVGLAGCLASARDLAAESGGEPTSETDDCVEVGDPDEGSTPHSVVLENEGETDREVTIEIRIDDESAFDDSRELAAGERLEFRLAESTDYRLSIESAGSRSELHLEGASTECTDSETTITLSDRGISTETVSTTGDCPPNETTVGDDEFEHGDGECASGDETDRATIDLEPDLVRIEGVVETPTPCHRLSLAGLEADRETLEIVVGVDEPETDVCVQCLGAVPYTAVVDRPEPLPESVIVVHETMGERRAVAEREC